MYFYSYIILGAGFSGSVLAERIAVGLGEKVLLIENRRYPGGNCYDYKDENGLIIHKFGPHLFHTNNKEVFDYLSRFTKWLNYTHKVLVCIDDKKIPLPFNFNSMDKLFELNKAKEFKKKLLLQYKENEKVPILNLLENKDEDLRYLAKFIYEKIFLNYTIKQWGIKPQELDISVSARVPIFVGYDDRYFNDEYQGVPLCGYTEIFKNMLSHHNIELLLNTDFKNIGFLKDGKIYILGREYKGKLIYTGSIDELFGYKFGRLKYRTLNMEFEELETGYFQESAVVNYPNDYDFTRITEFKHIHPVKTDKTVILKEYPKDAVSDEEIRYYPFFTKESAKQYEKYKNIAKDYSNLILLGRLAEYKYYDMDDAVERALKVYNDIKGVNRL
jgi:UDP-galactopyranose mutase